MADPLIPLCAAKSGLTTLQQRGHIDILRYLHTIPDGDTLQSARPREKGVPDGPNLIKSTLFYAVQGGHLDVVRLLVEERHHPLTTDVAEPMGFLPGAIAKQRWPIVEYLQPKEMKLQNKKMVALAYAA